jgi:hypothetical protein
LVVAAKAEAPDSRLMPTLAEAVVVLIRPGQMAAPASS